MLEKSFDYNELHMNKYIPIHFDFSEDQLKLLLQVFSQHQHSITKLVVNGHSQFCECVESFWRVSLLKFIDIVVDENHLIQKNFSNLDSVEIMRCPKCMTWTVSNYF